MSIADYIIVTSSPLELYSFYWNVIGSLNEILSRDYDAQYLLRVNLFGILELNILLLLLLKDLIPFVLKGMF